MATELERLAPACREPVLLLVDPNCRPRAIPDAEPYLARIRRILARADIVKVSTEDLAFLAPGAAGPEAAPAARCRAGVVLVTDGPALIRAFAGQGGYRC